MRKKNLIAGVVACGITATLADAATLRYRASGDWNQITDGTTPGWGPNPVGVGTAVPGNSDDARINFGNNTVTVTTAGAQADRVQIGVDESGIVEVNSGGVLTAARDILAGNNNAAATGTLTVNAGGVVNVGDILWAANNDSTGVINLNAGGEINVGSHLWWGVTGTATIGITGTLNQTGGILGLGTNNASTPGGGTATVTIGDGGVLNLNNISGSAGLPSIQPGSQLIVNGTGIVTLPTDRVGSFQDYIDAGKISGSGPLAATFDANTNLTTLQVIPEPSSTALIGLAGGLLLARRRRSN